jgi:type I restriction enzyme M protein
MEKIWYYDLSEFKVGKKTPLTLGHFEEFFRLLPQRADSERSWTVPREDIEAKNFGLKAVNPHAKGNEDTRKPEGLLDLIGAKSCEVAEALSALRSHKTT